MKGFGTIVFFWVWLVVPAIFLGEGAMGSSEFVRDALEKAGMRPYEIRLTTNRHRRLGLKSSEEDLHVEGSSYGATMGNATRGMEREGDGDEFGGEKYQKTLLGEDEMAVRQSFTVRLGRTPKKRLEDWRREQAELAKKQSLTPTSVPSRSRQLQTATCAQSLPAVPRPVGLQLDLFDPLIGRRFMLQSISLVVAATGRGKPMVPAHVELQDVIASRLQVSLAAAPRSWYKEAMIFARSGSVQTVAYHTFADEPQASTGLYEGGGSVVVYPFVGSVVLRPYDTTLGQFVPGVFTEMTVFLFTRGPDVRVGDLSISETGLATLGSVSSTATYSIVSSDLGAADATALLEAPILTTWGTFPSPGSPPGRMQEVRQEIARGDGRAAVLQATGFSIASVDHMAQVLAQVQVVQPFEDEWDTNGSIAIVAQFKFVPDKCSTRAAASVPVISAPLVRTVTPRPYSPPLRLETSIGVSKIPLANVTKWLSSKSGAIRQIDASTAASYNVWFTGLDTVLNISSQYSPGTVPKAPLVQLLEFTILPAPSGSLPAEANPDAYEEPQSSAEWLTIMGAVARRAKTFQKNPNFANAQRIVTLATYLRTKYSLRFEWDATSMTLSIRSATTGAAISTAIMHEIARNIAYVRAINTVSYTHLRLVRIRATSAQAPFGSVETLIPISVFATPTQPVAALDEGVVTVDGVSNSFRTALPMRAPLLQPGDIAVSADLAPLTRVVVFAVPHQGTDVDDDNDDGRVFDNRGLPWDASQDQLVLATNDNNLDASTTPQNLYELTRDTSVSSINIDVQMGTGIDLVGTYGTEGFPMTSPAVVQFTGTNIPTRMVSEMINAVEYINIYARDGNASTVASPGIRYMGLSFCRSAAVLSDPPLCSEPVYVGIEVQVAVADLIAGAEDGVVPSLPAPKALGAVFSSDGVFITLSFDRPTDRGGSPSGLIPCTDIIEASSEAAFAVIFGVGASCSWVSPFSFRVALGYNPTVLPEDLVAIRSGTVRALGASLGSDSILRTELVIASPSFSTQASTTSTSTVASPRIVLEARSQVGTCATVFVLDVRSSPNVGGRAPFFSYSIVSTENIADTDKLDDLRDFLADAAGLQYVEIPVSLLDSGAKYWFDVQAIDMFGRVQKLSTQRGTAHGLTVQTRRLPTVTFPNGRFRTVDRSQDVIFTAVGAVPTCDSSPEGPLPSEVIINYAWKTGYGILNVVSDADGTITTLNHSVPVTVGASPNSIAPRDPRQLVLPARTLRAGYRYTFTVTVSVREPGTVPLDIATVTTTVTVVVRRRPLAVGLVGGSRTVSAYGEGSVVLDGATQSEDPDLRVADPSIVATAPTVFSPIASSTIHSYKYTWSCTVADPGTNPTGLLERDQNCTDILEGTVPSSLTTPGIVTIPRSSLTDYSLAVLRIDLIVESTLISTPSNVQINQKRAATYATLTILQNPSPTLVVSRIGSGGAATKVTLPTGGTSTLVATDRAVIVKAAASVPESSTITAQDLVYEWYQLRGDLAIVSSTSNSIITATNTSLTPTVGRLSPSIIANLQDATGPNLELRPNVLSPGFTYLLEVRATDPTGSSETATASFSITGNAAPSGGVFLATPATGGVAYQTDFTISANGFSDNPSHLPITYSLFVDYQGRDQLANTLTPSTITSIATPIRSESLRSTYSKVRLGPGLDASNNYSVTIYAILSDRYGASRIVATQVESLPLEAVEDTTFSFANATDVANLVLSIQQSVLNDALQVRDSVAALQLTASLSNIVNKGYSARSSSQGQSGTSSNGQDPVADATLASFRDIIMAEHVAAALTTAVDDTTAYLVAAGVRDLASVPSELSDASLDLGLEAVLQITTERTTMALERALLADGAAIARTKIPSASGQPVSIPTPVAKAILEVVASTMALELSRALISPTFDASLLSDSSSSFTSALLASLQRPRTTAGTPAFYPGQPGSHFWSSDVAYLEATYHDGDASVPWTPETGTLVPQLRKAGGYNYFLGGGENLEYFPELSTTSDQQSLESIGGHRRRLQSIAANGSMVEDATPASGLSRSSPLLQLIQALLAGATADSVPGALPVNIATSSCQFDTQTASQVGQCANATGVSLEIPSISLSGQRFRAQQLNGSSSFTVSTVSAEGDSSSPTPNVSLPSSLAKLLESLSDASGLGINPATSASEFDLQVVSWGTSPKADPDANDSSVTGSYSVLSEDGTTRTVATDRSGFQPTRTLGIEILFGKSTQVADVSNVEDEDGGGILIALPMSTDSDAYPDGSGISLDSFSSLVSSGLDSGSPFAIFSAPLNDTVLRGACVWYDVTTSSFSSDGCTFVGVSDGSAICRCNHLTDFKARFELLITQNEKIFRRIPTKDDFRTNPAVFYLVGALLLLALGLFFFVGIVDSVQHRHFAEALDEDSEVSLVRSLTSLEGSAARAKDGEAITEPISYSAAASGRAAVFSCCCTAKDEDELIARCYSGRWTLKKGNKASKATTAPPVIELARARIRATVRSVFYGVTDSVHSNERDLHSTSSYRQVENAVRHEESSDDEDSLEEGGSNKNDKVDNATLQSAAGALVVHSSSLSDEGGEDDEGKEASDSNNSSREPAPVPLHDLSTPVVDRPVGGIPSVSETRNEWQARLIAESLDRADDFCQRSWNLRSLVWDLWITRILYNHSLITVFSRFDYVRDRRLRLAELLAVIFGAMFVAAILYSGGSRDSFTFEETVVFAIISVALQQPIRFVFRFLMSHAGASLFRIRYFALWRELQIRKAVEHRMSAKLTSVYAKLLARPDIHIPLTNNSRAAQRIKSLLEAKRQARKIEAENAAEASISKDDKKEEQEDTISIASDTGPPLSPTRQAPRKPPPDPYLGTSRERADSGVWLDARVDASTGSIDLGQDYDMHSDDAGSVNSDLDRIHPVIDDDDDDDDSLEDGEDNNTNTTKKQRKRRTGAPVPMPYPMSPPRPPMAKDVSDDSIEDLELYGGGGAAGAEEEADLDEGSLEGDIAKKQQQDEDMVQQIRAPEEGDDEQYDSDEYDEDGYPLNRVKKRVKEFEKLGVSRYFLHPSKEELDRKRKQKGTSSYMTQGAMLLATSAQRVQEERAKERARRALRVPDGVKGLADKDGKRLVRLAQIGNELVSGPRIECVGCNSRISCRPAAFCSAPDHALDEQLRQLDDGGFFGDFSVDDVVDSGWQEPPECCVQRCPNTVRRCGRHPEQRDVFLRRWRAVHGRPYGACWIGDPPEEDAQDDDSVENTDGGFTGGAADADNAAFEALLEAVSCQCRLVEPPKDDIVADGLAYFADPRTMARAQQRQAQEAAEAGAHGSSTAHLSASERLHLQLEKLSKDPAIAAVEKRTLRMAPRGSIRDYTVVILSFGAFFAFLIGVLFFILQFGLVYGEAVVLAFVQTFFISQIISFFVVQPLIHLSIIYGAVVVRPSFSVWCGWMPCCGTSQRGDASNRTVLSGRLESVSFVQAAGAASGLSPPDAVLAYATAAALSAALAFRVRRANVKRSETALAKRRNQEDLEAEAQAGDLGNTPIDISKSIHTARSRKKRNHNLIRTRLLQEYILYRFETATRKLQEKDPEMLDRIRAQVDDIIQLQAGSLATASSLASPTLSNYRIRSNIFPLLLRRRLEAILEAVQHPLHSNHLALTNGPDHHTPSLQDYLPHAYPHDDDDDEAGHEREQKDEGDNNLAEEFHDEKESNSPRPPVDGAGAPHSEAFPPQNESGSISPRDVRLPSDASSFHSQDTPTQPQPQNPPPSMFQRVFGFFSRNTTNSLPNREPPSSTTTIPTLPPTPTWAPPHLHNHQSPTPSSSTPPPLEDVAFPPTTAAPTLPAHGLDYQSPTSSPSASSESSKTSPPPPPQNDLTLSTIPEEEPSSSSSAPSAPIASQPPQPPTTQDLLFASRPTPAQRFNDDQEPSEKQEPPIRRHRLSEAARDIIGLDAVRSASTPSVSSDSSSDNDNQQEPEDQTPSPAHPPIPKAVVERKDESLNDQHLQEISALVQGALRTDIDLDEPDEDAEDDDDDQDSLQDSDGESVN